MRIDALRSAVEAAGVAMAPSADQFEGEPTPMIVDFGTEAVSAKPAASDAGNYSRSWARPVFVNGFPHNEPAQAGFKQWFTARWVRALSA